MLFNAQSSFAPSRMLHHLALMLSVQSLLHTVSHAAPIDETSVSHPVLSRRYAAGRCGVHVIQYQKNEPDVNPSSNYALDVTIYDANGAQIGGVSKVAAPGGQGVGVNSQLPYVLILTTGNVDNDPVTFAYADQNWDSNNQCSFGAYDSGSRQGDCGFSC